MSLIGAIAAEYSLMIYTRERIITLRNMNSDYVQHVIVSVWHETSSMFGPSASISPEATHK